MSGSPERLWDPSETGTRGQADALGLPVIDTTERSVGEVADALEDALPLRG